MGLRVIKVIFWGLVAVLLGCGSSSRPPVTEFVLVANLDASSVSTFNAADTISSLGDVSTGTCLGPRYLELHPTNGFLYATCQTSNTVARFSVDKNAAKLTLMGTPVPAGAAPTTLEFDPTGKFLYVTNLNGNSLSAYSVGSGGSLTEIAKSPFATDITPYTVKVSESGKFVYVANRDTNNVTAFQIEANTGALTEIAGSPFKTDLGARAIELSGKFAFVANRSAANVSVFTVNAATGALTQGFGRIDPNQAQVGTPRSGQLVLRVNF